LLLLFSILVAWGRGRSREEEEMVGGFHGRRWGGQPREKRGEGGSQERGWREKGWPPRVLWEKRTDAPDDFCLCI
jgi:hypothetical protein